eukprot:gene26866-33514_t
MLLDILRERVIDPQRLDHAIDTYTERMDCVNLATLLFHTGKKRLLLSPPYIKRIAERLNALKEELRAREASNSLYGMKCMSSEIPEVREMVLALAGKVASSTSEFVAQAVGNALYGCQMMTSEHEEVRFLLHVIANKVTHCTELLEAQNVGNALYGMRGMNSDYKEVRSVVAALTPKIATAREDLNGQALGNSLYGLQGMSCKESEVRSLMTVLATKVTRTWEELKAQEVGNALYGLKRMSTDVPEVRILIGALVPKIQSSPEVLDAQAIGNSFYGMQNMTSDSVEVLALLAVMAEKVTLACPELDGQAMGNSLYGLQGMNSEHAEVRAVVGALTTKLLSSCLDMNAQETGNALYGLQNMTTEHSEVRKLLVALTQKVTSSKHELTSQEIGNAMFGLQGMSSTVWETRLLIRQLALKIQQSHSIIDPQGVSNSLFGLQRMSSESEDVKLLVHSLATKIEHSWKLLSAQHLSNALFGMQGLCSAEKEVKYLFKALVPKAMSCRDEMSAKQLTYALFGLRGASSEHSEVLALLTSIAEKVALSPAQWTLQQLSMALFGLQGMNSGAEEVTMVLAAIANKTVNLGVAAENGNGGSESLGSPTARPVDANMYANAFYGLQRMSGKNSEVNRIVSTLAASLIAFSSHASLSRRMSARACGNIVYGLQGCSCASEPVRRVLYVVCDAIQLVVDSYGAQPPSSSPRHGKPLQQTAASGDRFEDILSLHQSLVLSLFVVSDLDCDPELKQRLLSATGKVEALVDRHKNEFVPRTLTAAEKRMCKETSDHLINEPYVLESGVLVHGFEMCAFVKLNPNVNLKSAAGVQWNPVVNIEIQGTSYTRPAKELFFQLRSHYLEQQHGVVVETLPAESFRVEGQSGLKYHPAVLNALYPPTQEDANSFAAKLCAQGLTGPMGLLSTVNLSEENPRNRAVSSSSLKSSGSNSLPTTNSFFVGNGSSNNTVNSGNSQGSNGSSPPDFSDDDFRRVAAPTVASTNLNGRRVALVPGHRGPLGMPTSWLGEWPTAVFAHSQTFTVNSPKNYNPSHTNNSGSNSNSNSNNNSSASPSPYQNSGGDKTSSTASSTTPNNTNMAVETGGGSRYSPVPPSHISPVGNNNTNQNTPGTLNRKNSSDNFLEGVQGLAPGPLRSTSHSFESTNTGLSSMTNSFYSPSMNSPGLNNMKGLSSTNGRSHLSLTVNTMAGGTSSASASPRYSTRDFNPAISAATNQQSGRFPVVSDDLMFTNKAGLFGSPHHGSKHHQHQLSEPNLALYTSRMSAAGTIGRNLEEDRRLRTDSSNAFEAGSGGGSGGAAPTLLNYSHGGYGGMHSLNATSNSAATTPAGDNTITDEAPVTYPILRTLSDYSIQSAVTMSPSMTPRNSSRGLVDNNNATVTLGGQAVFSNLLTHTRDLNKSSFRAGLERTASSIDEDEETVDESSSPVIADGEGGPAGGAEDDDVDAEIARVEAQLEIARLEAKLKTLKAKKQSKTGSTGPSKKQPLHDQQLSDIPTSVGSESPGGGLTRQTGVFLAPDDTPAFEGGGDDGGTPLL